MYEIIRSAYLCPDRLRNIIQDVKEASEHVAARLNSRAVLRGYRSLEYADIVEHHKAYKRLYERYTVLLDRPCLLLAFGVEYKHYELYTPVEPYMSYLKRTVFAYHSYLFSPENTSKRAFEPALIDAYLQWYVNRAVNPYRLACVIMDACR